jgi:diguanylate cyclase (GGDEF)-like protein
MNSVGSPGLSRRLLVTVGGVALAVLISGTALAYGQFAASLRNVRDERISGVTRAYAGELLTRLDAIQNYVRMASMRPVDAAPNLQPQLVRTNMIESVAVLPWKPPEAGAPETGLPAVSAADYESLRTGQTLLLFSTSSKGTQRLYQLHLVETAKGPAVAYFEMAPRWLWDQSGLRRLKVSLAVFDRSGHALFSDKALPDGIVRRLSATATGRDDLSNQSVYPWDDGGGKTVSTAVRVDPQVGTLAGDESWIVVGSVADSQFMSAMPQVLAVAPWLLMAAALASALAVIFLRERWEPPLQRMLLALEEWRAGRFVQIELGAAGDLPRELARSFNRVAPALSARLRALSTLREIDRLLLEAAEVEQCLERLLTCICSLTGCDGASVTLLDPDAPDRGRSFVAARDGTSQAVQRVAIDETMLVALSEAATGWPITEWEPERHCFLAPLHGIGAEFFWVWAVRAQERVAAILAVGCQIAPAATTELADYGTECAGRLSVALCNSVRDEQLYRQAHFDSLTALPNRLLFRDRLSQEIASSSDGSRRGALLYVDLDHFKKINDSAGHIAGDQLLTIVAQRLRACVKDGDTVARLGGDEFTVILREIDTPETAREVAERIIESLQRPVYIAGRDHKVLASIGITMFPDDGNSIDELMRNADLAMYQAKEGGRSQAVFFDSKMALPQSATTATSGLYRALRRREFSLYYQPAYSLKDGGLIGVEALLRWQPPRENMRLPQEFVPAAEESGLIVDIGGWVLDAACMQFADWGEQGVAPRRLSINVSVQQLRAPEFAWQVKRALERAGVPPANLELEITEPAFAEDDARATLQELVALGVRLALDNFGTGYSSLNHLRQLPLHAVKLDRSFVAELTAGSPAVILAQTMISMAHTLGKEVVAEGVETLEQLELLRAQGCDAAQGFVLAPPGNVVTITELLQGRGRRGAQIIQRKTG